MPKNSEPVYYSDYLQLEKILSAQKLESEKYGEPAHDEMLFVVIHQVYELWFKLIHHELDAVIPILSQEKIKEREMGKVNARVRRVNTILQKLVAQVDILETMTPLDFLDFRDYLNPASGFQSVQFRLLEAKLGLKRGDRLPMDRSTFKVRLKPEDQNLILAAEAEEGLLQLIDKWLSRLPFTETKEFEFWDAYRESVLKSFKADQETIEQSPYSNEEERKTELDNLESTKNHLLSLFDNEKFEALKSKGVVKLSQKALQAALFINLYRDEPLLKEPFNLISGLIDMDETLTRWRNRHALMAQRLLGTKIGTGGSSGHQYLRSTAQKNRVFTDFFNLASFLIPRSARPELPAELRDKLGFKYGE